MTTPTRYNVGDAVWITAASYLRMQDGNRSVKAHPGPTFLETTRPLVGITGKVVHTHLPGYEVTVEIQGHLLHMKDHWVERRAPDGHWLDAQIERDALHYGMSSEKKAALFDAAARQDEANPHW